MAVVEARKLTKRFDGHSPAVDALDLVTGDGEYLVLLGPSGSGKSTLLRLIAGLEKPTSGEVLIGGKEVAGLPPRDRSVAMVFQSYALYPHKTVAQNIDFPLKAQRIPAAQRKQKLDWAVDILDIRRLLNRKPRQLSGGERQRVALARALVRQPEVFLLDEPLSNLDAKLRTTARDDLKRFQQDVGVTTIYVTHDQVEAMGLGDRIAVMDSGRIRQLGTPQEIYDEPADAFVATFVGSPPMNIVRMESALVGFRPESLVTEDSAPPGALPVRLNVERSEFLGSDVQVIGWLREETQRVIAVMPAGAAVPEPGPVDFAVARSALRFFDPVTGRSAETQPLPDGLQ
ncbi:MAG: ABC transporter ATP-binding protein [Actinobacteria bacterium]|nr:ABC transporter ATP-binding protein [Actinomycetota bacterium]